MFVLVTQADGSAQRLTWATYALAVCLVAGYLQLAPGEGGALAIQSEAEQYFIDHPYIDVDPRFRNMISPEFAASLREAYFDERRSLGLPMMASPLIERSQGQFDALLETELSRIEGLPAWRHGVRSRDDAGTNFLAHFAVLDSRAALMISLFFLLCLGISLEDGWGTILFGFFAVSATALTAGVSTLVHYYDVVGSPWHGPSGLVSALLGAYFIRSLGGSARLVGAIPLPGFLMVPAWLAAEYVVVRGIDGPSAIASTTAIVHVVGFGIGAVVSLAIVLLGVEKRAFESSGESEELVENPVLDRALRAKDEGRLEVAFEMLRREFRRDSKNLDVAIALWDVGLEIDRASNVVNAIIVAIESELQLSNSSQAVKNWFQVVDHVPDYAPEAQFCVRMAEALLDESHPESALSLLHRAVSSEHGLTTGMAQRVVRIARDLDPELTRRAADIALCDSKLGMEEREELEQLSTEVVAVAAAPLEKTSAVSAPAPAQAAISSLESETESPAEHDWKDVDADKLDPQAIRLDALEEDLAYSPNQVSESDGWNEPGMLREFGSESLDDLGEIDDEVLEAVAQDLGLLDEVLEASHDDTVTRVNVAPPPPSLGDSVTEVDLGPDPGEETTTVVDVEPYRRTLKVRMAVPIRLEANAIVVEIDGGHKTRLPYERIDALAAAAVHGVSSKPVVVVDIVLNWHSIGDPLKVIRLRSDRFDPCALVPECTSPIEGLRKLLGEVLDGSGAVARPNRSAAIGSPFSVYADLGEYEASVLQVSSE